MLYLSELQGIQDRVVKVSFFVYRFLAADSEEPSVFHHLRVEGGV